MLSLSAKSVYGLKAVLLLAEHHGRDLLSIREIAARKSIPRQYLEQILNRLARAGIVKSARGKFGGYRLARPPLAVTASEVIAALEGDIGLAPDDNDPADVIGDLLRQAETRLNEVFSLSLADLLDRAREKKRIINFSI